MLTKKTTLQAASMLAEGANDENLKSRYGTSVDEYMSREHAKEVRQKINDLRGEFLKIGKDKNDTLTFEELTNFFNQNNVTQNLFYLIIIIKFIKF